MTFQIMFRNAITILLQMGQGRPQAQKQSATWRKCLHREKRSPSQEKSPPYGENFVLIFQDGEVVGEPLLLPHSCGCP